jgi:hypothetical protein
MLSDRALRFVMPPILAAVAATVVYVVHNVATAVL